MFNTHICKNCFKSFSGKPEVCPHCGEATGFVTKHKNNNNQQSCQEQTNKMVDHGVQYVDASQAAVAPKRKRRRRVSSREIMDGINFEDLLLRTNDSSVNSWRERKKQRNQPQYSVDKSGEYNIDTHDVTYLPNTYTYSVKKARGEVKRQKLKWWEVYKWADLMLARRKIKKQVRRASNYRPKEIKGWKMKLLCILFGWFGIHDLYARNYRKGAFAAVCFTIGCVLLFNWPQKLMLTAGFFLFIPVCMWVLDIINLIFGTYSYRLSRYKFIDCLNADTRAQLGDKYLDKDEYKKLWTVRMINKISGAAKERKARKAANITATEPKEQAKNSEEPSADIASAPQTDEQIAEAGVVNNVEENDQSATPNVNSKHNGNNNKAKLVVKNKRKN